MNNSAVIEQEIKKNFRFNFTVNLLDVSNFMFGYSFMSPGTILPVFVTHFSENPLLIGLIAFINTAGFLIPQLFTSNAVERAPVKKIFPFNYGFFLERIPVFILPLATAFLAVRSPILMLVVFYLLISWQNFGAGILMVGWQDMIAKIIPVESRGKFFGLSNFLGNFTAILGAVAVSWLLTKFPFPTGYVIAFGCAAVFIFISWVFLGQSREPPVPSEKPAVSTYEYFRALPQIIRSNRNFENYLITQIVSAFGAMAVGFIIVYAIERWKISDGQAASYSIAVLVGQSIANLIFGFLADRKGHKLVLELGILINFSAFVIALLAPAPAWLYIAFGLRGMNLAGNFISGTSLPLEFSDPQNRPTFIGLASTVPGIAGAVAPILAGGLAGMIGYQWLFSISAVITAATFCLMHWLVKDPRHLNRVTV